MIREATALPCTVRLHKTPDGYWMEHCCTGDYFVSGDGARIEYEPLPGASMDAVRFDLLGRVMALALHAGGWLCLHGSAIQLDGGVLGFIAPKGYGKSTLASALVREGARLSSDDLLVIAPGPPPVVLPGVSRLRLRDDSFGLLQDLCQAERGPDGKQVITKLSEERRMTTECPLAALYWLDPVEPTAGGPEVDRERLSSSEAARTLVSLGKNAIILGQLETLDVLERAFAVTREVPVYRLRISRDLERIGGVARRMMEWHGADALLNHSNT